MRRTKELLIAIILLMLSISVMTVKANDGESEMAPYYISDEPVSPVGEIYINKPEIPSEEKMEYLGEFTITYYCPCSRCNGKWGAIDGFGNPLKWGCVAVDPKVIKMHTKLVVDGFDMIFEARDTGSGVNGKHLDIFVPVSHSEALKMGQGEKKKVWLVRRTEV